MSLYPPFVLDWKSVCVKDGRAVAVRVITTVVNAIRVLKLVLVATLKVVLGVNAVFVNCRVDVFVETVVTVFEITLVVLSVLVEGVKIVIACVVVLTIVLVVVETVVSTLVVVLTIVENDVENDVVIKKEVMVLVVGITRICVDLLVDVNVLVDVKGKVNTILAILTFVVMQVEVTVLVNLL